MSIVFLKAENIIQYHEFMLERTPGLSGLADAGRVDALCNRVENLHYYEGEHDIFKLATMYLIAISRGHVFNDANKRTALHSTLMFLRLNGTVIRFERTMLVDLTVATASGSASIEVITQTLKNLAS